MRILNYRVYITISLFVATIHFISETVWHFIRGQYLPMLIVDYIAISLLFYACHESKNNELFSRVLFVGAWGFTFCLFYRALFIRLEAVQEGVELQYLTVSYIAMLMLLSGIMFIWGILGARKRINCM